MKHFTQFFAIFCLAFAALCSAQTDQAVTLTVYTDNFAVVREARTIDFNQGVNKIKFTDVASAIDPTSVNFECISSPGAVSILEQNYEYDLVSPESLLKRYIDKNVSVIVKGSGADQGRELAGRLMAAMGPSLILQTQEKGLEILDQTSIESVSLREMPEDLVTKPTLLWLADAKQKGSFLCQVSYTTGRLGWNADYSAILNQDETALDFSGWVTIDNKSGATYKQARIKLIAGDVRRITAPVPRRREMVYAAEAKAPAFEEKPFMEYHLYTLGRTSTINNNQVKQIEFITPALAVPVKKLFIYDRQQNHEKIQVKLEFENTAENRLGIALPKGKIRVFKKDPADASLEFVGEDLIDHTPRKEKLSLYIGDAFDIVPEYTLLDSKHGRRFSTETHKIELRNRKDTAVTVFVDEKFWPWTNWTIDQTTHKYEKKDAHTARFEVKIDADAIVTVQYTATQTW